MSEDQAKPKRKRKLKMPVPRYYQLLIPFAPEAARAINHELSEDLGRDYGYVQKGQCYKNSILAAGCLTYQLGHDVHVEYVEGWLIMGPEYAIEHGWLEVEQEVVDVTLAGEHVAASDYYAVYRYGMKDVEKLITQRGTKMPLFGNHVAGVAAMQEAYEHLPINQHAGVAMACIGYMKTGIWSVVIPEGAFLGKSHELHDRE